VPGARFISALLAFAAVWVSSAALADVLHLTDGRKIEGKVTRDDASGVEIQTKFGVVKVERAKIERIEFQRVPTEEVEFQLERAGEDATALYEVALLAEKHRMKDRYLEILQRVVEADPSHALANTALGKIQFEGQWYTPDELEAHKEAAANSMRKQGKVLHNGRWVKEETAKRLSGYELYKGQWLRWKEIYRLQSEEKMPELLGEMLDIRESEHFTLRSMLDEESQKELLEIAEWGYAHFEKVFRPDPKEDNMMGFFPIPIYVLPDPTFVPKFVESDGYMVQLYNPPKGINERYLDATCFPIFFPRPLIVTSLGRHLKGGGEGARKLTSLIGFISHFEGNVLVRRFKRGGTMPGWVESGMSHYYEGLLNGYQTLTITRYTGYENVPVWEKGLETFPEWYKMMADADFRRSLPSIAEMRSKPVEELVAHELVKSYFLVYWLMEERPQEFVDYVRLAYSQKFQPRVTVSEEEAFFSVWPEGPGALDEAFLAWAEGIEAQPPE